MKDMVSFGDSCLPANPLMRGKRAQIIMQTAEVLKQSIDQVLHTPDEEGRLMEVSQATRVKVLNEITLQLELEG